MCFTSRIEAGACAACAVLAVTVNQRLKWMCVWSLVRHDGGIINSQYQQLARCFWNQSEKSFKQRENVCPGTRNCAAAPNTNTSDNISAEIVEFHLSAQVLARCEQNQACLFEPIKECKCFSEKKNTVCPVPERKPTGLPSQKSMIASKNCRW